MTVAIIANANAILNMVDNTMLMVLCTEADGVGEVAGVTVLGD